MAVLLQVVDWILFKIPKGFFVVVVVLQEEKRCRPREDFGSGMS